jgi:electron transfer flavoprotein beta subunit
VVSLGPNDAAKEIRTCLAMGADRAIHVATSDAEIDALIVVKVLSAIVAAEKPDVVIMGKQAVDGDANQVGQMLAAKLGWPQATFAASIELSGEPAALTVGREVDGGVEYKKVPLHSVITVDRRIVAPRAVKNGVTPESHNYSGEGARLPSLKGIMAAKKKPMAQAKLADYRAPGAVISEEDRLPAVRAKPEGRGQPTLVKLVDEAKAL